MGYHPRIETTNFGSFLTTRTKNEELWFVNNKPLEDFILGAAAKLNNRYGTTLYALSIEGDHIQAPALFPKGNRADFMRDFNSSVARAVCRFVPSFPGGRLWQRRYSAEYLCDDWSIEDKFFYTVLQPVQDGLAPTIGEYPGYNCFHDAVYGIKRKYKVVRWQDYHEKCRWSKEVSIKDFTDEFELEYARLPGYEHLSRKEYAKLMHEKLEQRRLKVLEERVLAGKVGFVGAGALQAVLPGTRAKSPKKSTRYSHRPRVFALDWALHMKWYFDLYDAYKEASYEYRHGNLEVSFPPGTYRPPLFTTAYTVALDEMLH